MRNHYGELPPNAANHVALSPVSFLKRAETVYASRTAHIYGDTKRSWAEVAARCRSLADALGRKGIGAGDTVAVICPNIPELAELHFAVPMAGAVLNTINTRLEADTIAYILGHGDAKLVICDTQYADLLRQALEIAGLTLPVIDIIDANGPGGEPFGTQDYESLVAEGDAGFAYRMPSDEWEAICLNYTSGTSGRPKGVVYHHRGAYLMAMGTVAAWGMGDGPVYLSVVPMFHCNGWNHPWMMAVVGATMVFTRDPVPERILAAIEAHGVTHFGGAPIILQMLVDSADAPKAPFSPRVRAMTAGAPPPPAILQKSAAIGLDVMQVYGLTETYGHITQCLWREEWDDLDAGEQAQMQAMQGVAFPMLEDASVLDRETGEEVPRDGVTQGEIVIRGNTVMMGYYKDAETNREAFKDGWFWSGDAAVVHPNGYIQIRDRLKDVIISGGENISSVEVEGVLYKHDAVLAAAVVAMPHEKWGEVPCAYVELRDGASSSADEIMTFARQHLAGFKVPKAVVFETLPKTSTGKIQKFVLREKARSGAP